MAFYRLNVPTYDATMDRKHPLWRYYGLETGRTLIKTDGTWRLVTTPTTEALLAAEDYFRGGYQHTVDQATRDDLVADGFGDYLVEIT